MNFDQDTQSTLDSQPSWVAEKLSEGIAMRSQAKVMQDEVDAIKGEANALLDMALTCAKLKKAVSSVGTILIKSTTRSNINKTKLAEVLVAKGVKADVVAKSIDAATTKSESSSVTFTLPKKPV